MLILLDKRLRPAQRFKIKTYEQALITGCHFLLLNRQYSILLNMCTSEKYEAQLIRNQQHEYE